MNEYDYKNLTPFKWFILENFPFIEETFDALTNYQLFCKLGEEINKIIDNVNESGEEVETLSNSFIALQNYVNNYFSNLDVQDEIDNKLDEMAQNGTLGEILQTYVQPIVDSLNTRIQEVENDYTVTNNRIDEIMELPQGSTTGDAQLADIKNGFDGRVFTTPGEAVRNEDELNYNKIKLLNFINNIENVEYEQGGITQQGQPLTSNYFIRSKTFLNSNSNYYINFKNNDYYCVIVWYNENETIATSTMLTIRNSRIIPTAYPKFKIVMRKTTDNTTITPNDAMNIYLTFSPLQNSKINYDDNIIINFDNTNKKINIKSKLDYILTDTQYFTFYNQNIEINYPTTTGTTYGLFINTITENVELLTNIAYKNSNYVNLLYFIMPVSEVITPQFVFNYTKNTMIDNILINSKYKNISILGDSYSTFENWILPDDRGYYPYDGNDVTNVSETYWHKLLLSFNAGLITNDSFGGSTVAHTIRPNHTYSDSFIERMKNSLGIGRNGQAKPDLILICGGTNDYWNNVPLGELKYSNWTDTDLENFLPAFCYMLDYIKYYNPTAKIVHITNDVFSNEYKTGINTACTHYGVVNVQLSDISKQTNHPDINGMNSIFLQTLNTII